MVGWVEVEAKGCKWLVSTDGRVKAPAHETAYTRTRGGKVQTFKAQFPERELSPCKARHGYLEVAAMRDGKRIKVLLHRLVALAHVPGFRDGLSVNHIDGNKLNNHPANLEWVSLARNAQHAWETGLVNLRGEAQPGAKLTSKRVIYIRRLLAQGIPAHTLAIVAGVSDSTIGLIRDGKRWPGVTGGKPVIAG